MQSPTILITGCSRGIGKAAALDLSARGWTVIGTLRSEAGREDLENAGVEVAQLDVRDSVEVDRVVAEVVSKHGHLDGLVANAGLGLFGCFEDLDEDQMRDLFDVNFFGVLSCARAALPHLRASGGRLVVISSVAGRRAAPGSSLYNATKFALEGWAEALSLEVEPLGVRVVLVEPGATESGFATSSARGPRVGTGPYADLTRRVEVLRDTAFSSPEPVDTVVRAIHRGLKEKNPPLRIPTGRGTLPQILAHDALPWSAWKALVGRKLQSADRGQE